MLSIVGSGGTLARRARSQAVLNLQGFCDADYAFAA
jgi:hypothetical protein